METEKTDRNKIVSLLINAREYGLATMRASPTKKMWKSGAEVILKRVNTPEKIPAVYVFIRTDGKYGTKKTRVTWFTFVEIQGSEGISFAGSLDGYEDVTIIRSHAVSRYMERHGWDGSRTECENHLLKKFIFTYRDIDKSTNEVSIYMDDGMMLGVLKNDIIYINTYIANSQMYSNQRTRSRFQEVKLNDAKINMAEIYSPHEKELINKLDKTLK